MNFDEMVEAVSSLDLDRTMMLLRRALDAEEESLQIFRSLNKGMVAVGEKYEKGEYFLAELIMGGEIMKQALDVLRPYLSTQNTAKGKVVLGTVIGDLHDIGKDIVKTLLLSEGFEVLDLGIDVPPAMFAQKAKETGASIVGVSALLSNGVARLGDVVEELKKAGISHNVRVIAGGAAVRKDHVKKYGVDAAVNDAVEGVNIIRRWVGGE